MPDPAVHCRVCREEAASSPRTRLPRRATHFAKIFYENGLHCGPEALLYPVCGVHRDEFSDHPSVTLEEGLAEYVVQGVMGA